MEIQYAVKIDIDTIDVEANYIAFRTRRYHDNVLVSEAQGITTKENFAAMNAFGEFAIIDYALWDLSILELHKKSVHNKAFYEAMNTSFVEKPYDVVFNGNWHNKYFLARYYSGSDDFIAPNGLYLPKAIYIDYMACMTNDKYDLIGILSAIQNMPNVICLSNTVERIPYYNADEDCNKHIRFIFVPTVEEYQNLQRFFGSNKADKVIDVLGLQRFRKN